jgi:hypothetical protein
MVVGGPLPLWPKDGLCFCILRDNSLFAGLDENTLRVLAQGAFWREYSAGEVVALETLPHPDRIGIGRAFCVCQGGSDADFAWYNVFVLPYNLQRG